MRIISLWDPWASFIAAGHKRYETRAWKTPYRGPLAIHAAQTPKCIKDGTTERLVKEIGEDWEKWKNFNWPYGKIIVLCDLKDCIRTIDCRKDIHGVDRILGDYSVGRWAWRLENVRVLKNPIPFKGMQGIRVLPKEIEEQVLREAA